MTMFDTTFSYASTSAIAPSVSYEAILSLMHDYDLIAHLNPDCLGVHLVQQLSPSEWQYRVEDALAFIPKRLWSGGVSYTTLFAIRADGCDITINAPGGFTSVNRWRLQRGEKLLGADGAAVVTDDVERDEASGGEELVLRITSDAKCSVMFAVFVKRFLETSHVQLQNGFREQVRQRHIL